MSSRFAFVVDVNRCTGCHACEMACQIANRLPADRRWREVVTYNELHVPGVEHTHLSLACNHCREAPCMAQCPARAYHRDERTGAVLINAEACLGCGYCAWACPYNAPKLDPARGVMTKCTFCHDKLLAGGRPACVTSCPTEALQWREVADADLVQAGPGFAQAGTDPSIRVEGVRAAHRVPQQTAPPVVPPWRDLRRYLPRHISLGHEWPLAVFTLTAACLVGGLIAMVLGGLALDGRVFLGLGAAAMALSAAHLGRRERAWRAPLHIRRSHLSREIVLFSGFLLLAAPVVLAPRAGAGAGWLSSSWLGAAAAITGVLALLAIDLVYRPARVAGNGRLHSAHVLGTGLLLAAAGSGAVAAVAALAGVKAVLFVARQIRRARLGLGADVGLVVPRLGFLAAGLGCLLQEPATSARWTAASLLLIAEALDRGLYYAELEIPTPQSLMLADLAGRPEAAEGGVLTHRTRTC